MHYYCHLPKKHLCLLHILSHKSFPSLLATPFLRVIMNDCIHSRKSLRCPDYIHCANLITPYSKRPLFITTVVYSPVMNNCVAFKTIQLATELFSYVVECVFSLFSSSVFIPTHTKKKGCEKKGGES